MKMAAFLPLLFTLSLMALLISAMELQRRFFPIPQEE
jgi:hypothetical protein